MQRYGRAHRLTCIVVQYMATEEGTSRGALALRRYPSSGEMTDEDGVDVCMWSTAVGSVCGTVREYSSYGRRATHCSVQDDGCAPSSRHTCTDTHVDISH